jgi:hypothetical protein
MGSVLSVIRGERRQHAYDLVGVAFPIRACVMYVHRQWEDTEAV